MQSPPTPKDRFTSLDTLALARELRALPRPRVDKVFDLPGGGWALALRTSGEGRRELLLVPGRYAALLPPSPGEHAEALTPLARELRRLLVGAVVRGVQEPAGERFLELELGRGDDPSPLVVALEMFGAGNLIVAQDGQIVAAAQARRWAHRTVRVGVAYTRPPVRLDPWTVDRSALEMELTRSHTDLASTLAARLSFGGPVAEELIERAGLEGSEPAAARAPEAAARLALAIAELLREVGDRPQGYLYVREQTAVDATPYPSRRWSGDPTVRSETHATFSEAARAYFRTLVVVPPSPEAAEAERLRRSRERLQHQQTEAIAELTASIERLRRSAEAIFAHYAEVEAALHAARQSGAVAGKLSLVLDGNEVTLGTDGTPREAAQALYAEMKRLQAKLAGARTALAETERRLESPARSLRSPRPRSGDERPVRSKTHWFERFRWFISSEGAIVIAGRDASSNDQIVRRHLRDNDRYVHADLQGAASVIVKHPAPGRPPIGEATLREAGQWAVVYSKAWRAGLASASAFWVTAEQVSKAGPSGEFVAKGAWAIQGTKHVLDDLPTEIALGTIDYEGATLWTAAPPAAIAARGTVRVVLVPGAERERDALEVELTGELGLTRTRLQGLLPAGGIARRRT